VNQAFLDLRTVFHWAGAAAAAAAAVAVAAEDVGESGSLAV
jgi:hypothetical protein